MTTTWTIAVDWDRNDNFTGPYDDVTARVMAANWSLGFKAPNQDTPDNSAPRNISRTQKITDYT